MIGMTELLQKGHTHPSRCRVGKYGMRGWQSCYRKDTLTPHVVEWVNRGWWGWQSCSILRTADTSTPSCPHRSCCCGESEQGVSSLCWQYSERTCIRKKPKKIQNQEMGELNSAQKMPHERNKDPSALCQLSPGMQVTPPEVHPFYCSEHSTLAYHTVLYWATLPLPALVGHPVTAARGVVLYSSVLSHLTSASTCGASSDCRKRCQTVLYWATLPLPALVVHPVTAGRGVRLPALAVHAVTAGRGVVYCTEPPYLCQHLQWLQWLQKEVLYCTLVYWATLPLPALVVHAVTAGRGVGAVEEVSRHQERVILLPAD